MPLAVATRTVIRRGRRLLFLWGSFRAGVQARRCPGYLGGSLRVARGSEFWTLTLWKDGSSMNAFRTSGAHGDLMPKLAGWASQASTTGWLVERKPSWVETHDRMATSALWLDVERPDARHRGRSLEPSLTAGLSVPLPKLRNGR